MSAPTETQQDGSSPLISSMSLIASSFDSCVNFSELREMDELEVLALEKEVHNTSLTAEEFRLVGEKPLYDEETENEGCEQIVGALTMEERAHLSDAHMPLRYFRAEKGDIASATKKLKATIAWRRDFEVEKIRRCFEDDGDMHMRKIIAQENETGKIYTRGYDREGRAVLYLHPGLENSNDEINNMRHLVYNLERVIAATAAMSGKEKFNIVISYKGFKLRNAPPISVVRHTVDILQNHYPERMYRAYVCDPPVVFRTFWSLVKPFIDPVTKEKLQFCHGKVGKATLEERFDLETTEKCAAGTRDLRPFNSTEYLYSRMGKTFDE